MIFNSIFSESSFDESNAKLMKVVELKWRSI